LTPHEVVRHSAVVRRGLIEAIAREPLPLAFVDLEALDRNIEKIAAPARARNKKLRVASKSIRSIELLRRIVEKSGACGIMAYAVREAEFLATHGFSDVLIAYPTAQRSDLELFADLTRRGVTVSIVVDSIQHLDLLEAAGAAAGVKLAVIVEVDMSYRPLAGAIHLGVRRSPLHDVEEIARVCTRAAASAHLSFKGLMGYEAHIAGLPDRKQFAPLLKTISTPRVKALRREIVDALRAKNIAIEIFNGGGTGSLSSSTGDDALTEVTAGSGFLQSHLFDGYRASTAEPAAFFALQVVRRAADRIVTCHGGGYIASGEAGKDRLPVVAWPEGGELLALEGAGEVQTPVRLPKNIDVPLGAPIIFRHAKAGELAEHFDEYLMIQGTGIVGRAKTYRGAGQNFIG
jgi:D-serine deaminase-like pyridoxal phosphate-dependent protein